MKFKIGDIVRVRFGQSTSSSVLNGKIGKITSIGKTDRGYFVSLDIESIDDRCGGVWFDEIELMERVVKTYGIVKFMEETNKR